MTFWKAIDEIVWVLYNKYIGGNETFAGGVFRDRLVITACKMRKSMLY